MQVKSKFPIHSARLSESLDMVLVGRVASYRRRWLQCNQCQGHSRKLQPFDEGCVALDIVEFARFSGFQLIVVM